MSSNSEKSLEALRHLIVSGDRGALLRYARMLAEKNVYGDAFLREEKGLQELLKKDIAAEKKYNEWKELADRALSFGVTSKEVLIRLQAEGLNLSAEAQKIRLEYNQRAAAFNRKASQLEKNGASKKVQELQALYMKNGQELLQRRPEHKALILDKIRTELQVELLRAQEIKKEKSKKQEREH